MVISMHLLMLIVNDVLLIVLKKTSDKYSTSECRSKCCNWYWNVKQIREKSKTNDTLESVY